MRVLFVCLPTFLISLSPSYANEESIYTVEKTIAQDCNLTYRIFQKESGLEERSFLLNLSQLQQMQSILQQLRLIQSYPKIQESFNNLKAGVIAGGTGYAAAKIYTLFHRLSLTLKQRFLVLVTLAEGGLGYAMERWDLFKEELPEEDVKENELSLFISPQTEKAIRVEIEELIRTVEEREECEEKTWPPSFVTQQYITVFSLLAP